MRLATLQRIHRAVGLALGAILFVMLVGGCGGSEDDSAVEAETTATATTSALKTAVVIDSDGGFDDLKAILFLLERPDVDVLALTMSGTGIAHCPDAAQNMSAVLERIGAPEIPISCGRSSPLRGDNQAPALWRSAADSMGGVDLPSPRPLAEAASPELLAETIMASDRAVVLVALGPLTNVAQAIESDATVLDNVEMVYLMGGAVDDGGNVMYENPAAEFNIWADPYAAGVVFDTDVSITLIALDATNNLPVTPYLRDAVEAHREVSPVSRLLAEYLERSPFVGGLYHWDELAAVAMVDPSVVTFEERSLAIVEEGGVAAGATIEVPDGRPVRVAVAADREIFEAVFYDTIIGTSDPGIAPWEADAIITWDDKTCEYSGPEVLPDRPLVQINNLGSDVVAVLTGRYAPGTTVEDWDTYRASGDDRPPSWWSTQGTLFIPVGAHDVWVLDAGPDVTALCFADAEHLYELAGPSLAEATVQDVLEVEPINATVVFENETCVYEGPTELARGAIVTYGFETTAEDVALIVVGVHAGTTWQEVADFVVDHPATTVPPFIDYVRMEVQNGPGSMDMTMQSGAYLVTCNTSRSSTDTAHPAELIEVAE